MHTWVFATYEQRNESTAIPRPSYTEDPQPRGSGIIPGAIAAAVFIGFVLGLYAVLWKCMVSPPQRKKRRVRVRDKRSQVCWLTIRISSRPSGQRIQWIQLMHQTPASQTDPERSTHTDLSLSSGCSWTSERKWRFRNICIKLGDGILWI